MNINALAAQLLELQFNYNNMIISKPRRVYKFYSKEYQNRIEAKYGEYILRNVIKSSNFGIPSEDFTGRLNETIARKTRDIIKMHLELEGPDFQPVEELNIVADEEGSKKKRVDPHKYAPLLFEECYIKEQEP